MSCSQSPSRFTGGVFLVKLLHLNFSVAVWVGFIALFGTAVQTGVVMVIFTSKRPSPAGLPATAALPATGLHAGRHGGCAPSVFAPKS